MMPHPVFYDRRFLQFFITGWSMVLLGHAAVLYFFLGYPISLALFEAGIFTLVFVVLVLGIWYPVRFLYHAGFSVSESILRHLVLAGGTVFLWFIAGKPLTELLLQAENPVGSADLDLGRVLTGILIYGLQVQFLILHLSQLQLQEKVRQEGELRQLATQSELDLLKLQINPHFLFNSLNSIYVLNQTQPGEAGQMILELSEFLRFSLRGDPNGIHTLRKELDQIQRYLHIEKIRFGTRLAYQFDLNSEDLDSPIPVMILQPVYENAVKHGLNAGLAEMTIHTRVRLKEHGIEIEVTNPYQKGHSAQVGTGSGLQNISRRMALWYQDGSLVKVNPGEQFFSVELFFPISK